MGTTGEGIKYCANRYDLLGRFLFQKLGLSTTGTILVIFAAVVFEYFILPYDPGKGPSDTDYVYWFTTLPIVWGYYASTCTRITRLIVKTQHTTVEDTGVWAARVYDIFQSPVWPILAILATIVLMSIIVFGLWPQYPPTYASSPTHMIFSMTVMTFNSYAAFMIIVQEFLVVYWLRDFFLSFSVKVHPLHSDSAGGLGFIGKHYFHLSLFVIAIALFLSLESVIGPAIRQEQFHLDPLTILGWILYIIIVPAVFFVPTRSAHKAMKEDKARRLNELSVRFEDNLDALYAIIDEVDEQFQRTHQRTKSLHELYQLIETSFPTWPFSTRTLRRFAVSALLPILTTTASLLFEYYF